MEVFKHEAENVCLKKQLSAEIKEKVPLLQTFYTYLLLTVFSEALCSDKYVLLRAGETTEGTHSFKGNTIRCEKFSDVDRKEQGTNT